jgi:hypothetical protein
MDLWSPGKPPSNNSYICHRAIGEDYGTYMENIYIYGDDITSNSAVWKHIFTIRYVLDEVEILYDINDIIM